MKNKKVILDWRTSELKKTYENLSDNEPLKKKIKKAIEKIKRDPARAGNPISHKLIPKEYDEFPNAFHLKLSREWRLIYSITGINEVEILAIILDWFDNHKDYEKKFNYAVR